MISNRFTFVSSPKSLRISSVQVFFVSLYYHSGPYRNVATQVVTECNIIMGKRTSLFLGQASGKIGEVVFYRAGGEQRTRQYVATVNDKKSLAQVSQRALLSATVNAFRLLKPALINAFSTKAVNQSDYNSFVSVNKNAQLAYLTKQEALAGKFVFKPYQVSQGTLLSLPPVTIPSIEDAPENASILMGTSTVEGAQTLANLKALYLAKYSDATETDKLVFIGVKRNADGSYTNSFTEIDLSAAELPTGFDIISSATVGSPVYLMAPFAYSPTSATVAAGSAFIRKQIDSNSKVSVSTAALTLSVFAQTESTTYASEVQRMLAADSYGYNADTLI